jgi:hypothetical protein
MASDEKPQSDPQNPSIPNVTSDGAPDKEPTGDNGKNSSAKYKLPPNVVDVTSQRLGQTTVIVGYNGPKK